MVKASDWADVQQCEYIPRLCVKAGGLLVLSVLLKPSYSRCVCQGVEAAAFVRSTDPKLFPPGLFPNPDEVKDVTSGNQAPDLELFSAPFGWYQHFVGHKLIPNVDIGTVAAVLLR